LCDPGDIVPVETPILGEEPPDTDEDDGVEGIAKESVVDPVLLSLGN
jgi:hypothetical protein